MLRVWGLGFKVQGLGKCRIYQENTKEPAELSEYSAVSRVVCVCNYVKS